MAERDNPSPRRARARSRPPGRPARPRTAHGVHDPRGQSCPSQMLGALMQYPERTTAELAAASGIRARATARMAERLAALGLTACEYRSRYRCLARAAENTLLRVVAGPPRALPPVNTGSK